MNVQQPVASHQPLIVVGVDGSRAADAALRWAVRQAARQHGTVQAVTVHPRHPAMSAAAGTGAVPSQPAATVVHHHTTVLERLRGAVRAARAELADPPSVVEVAPAGDPAAELVRSAEDADLLVVGSHGRGAGRLQGSDATKAALGSVALSCLRHAGCPVVVIPPRAVRQAGPRR